MEAVVDAKYRPAMFLNGGPGAALAAVAKKMRPAAAAPSPAAWAAGEAVGVYRECLKNHAASLGGHALDGCGEFMPAPDADPAAPASLRCAACGCHRNFHRRLLEAPPSPPLLALPPPPPLPPAAPPLQPPAPPAPAPEAPPLVMHERDGRALPGEETPEDRRLPAAFDEDTDDDSDEGSEFDDEDRPISPMPAQAMGGAPGYLLQPASHMLLALSTGAPSGASSPAVALAPMPPPPGSLVPTMQAAAAAATAATSAARKRFRSKFSPEQKQMMRALSERLGWRLQKRDEAVVEDSCREIGVTKAVFKVWMHNNKHNFVGGHSARRSASASAAAAAAGTGASPILQSPHSAAVHPSVHAAPDAPAPPPPPPAAPFHADFNINGTASAADYFRIQPATATAPRGGSPQSC